MRWFKKKQAVTNQKKYECPHLWKNFDWYITGVYNGTQATVKIFQPFVCVYCKERKDMKLFETRRERANITSVQKFQDDIEEHYTNLLKNMQSSTKIKDRALVEAEINEFQLVDKHTLEIYKMLKADLDI